MEARSNNLRRTSGPSIIKKTRNELLRRRAFGNLRSSVDRKRVISPLTPLHRLQRFKAIRDKNLKNKDRTSAEQKFSIKMEEIATEEVPSQTKSVDGFTVKDTRSIKSNTNQNHEENSQMNEKIPLTNGDHCEEKVNGVGDDLVKEPVNGLNSPEVTNLTNGYTESVEKLCFIKSPDMPADNENCTSTELESKDDQNKPQESVNTTVENEDDHDFSLRMESSDEIIMDVHSDSEVVVNQADKTSADKEEESPADGAERFFPAEEAKRFPADEAESLPADEADSLPPDEVESLPADEEESFLPDEAQKPSTDSAEILNKDLSESDDDVAPSVTSAKEGVSSSDDVSEFPDYKSESSEDEEESNVGKISTSSSDDSREGTIEDTFTQEARTLRTAPAPYIPSRLPYSLPSSASSYKTAYGSLNRIHGRRGVRDFERSASTKRKADVLDPSSVPSPRWKFFRPSISNFWLPQNKATTNFSATSTPLKNVEDSMAVNFDEDSINYHVNDPDLSLCTSKKSPGSKSTWGCSIM